MNSNLLISDETDTVSKFEDDVGVIDEPALVEDVACNTPKPEASESEADESAAPSSDSSEPEAEPLSENAEAEEYLNGLIREERIAHEYAEFRSLFPDASVEELPDSVIRSIKSGVPLSAAYALYERRRAASEAAASGVNRKNRELSFAVKSKGPSEQYFSPDEVRQMSASEVKANYSKIIDSMSHWN